MNIPAEIIQGIEKVSRKRETLFLQLMQTHENIVFYCIKKYGEFSHSRDVADYKQEIYLLAWQYFSSYEVNPRLSFSTFLFNQSKWAILQFRQKHEWYNENVYLREFLSENCMVDQNYTEEHIDSLRKAIADLSDEDQFIVNLYLEGESLAGASVLMGKYASYYRNRLVEIRDGIREKKNRYFQDMVDNYEKNHRRPGHPLGYLSKPLTIGYIQKKAS